VTSGEHACLHSYAHALTCIFACCCLLLPAAACCCLLLQPKPEVGIQFGAGGTSSAASLAAEGARDVRQLVKTCQAFLQQVNGCRLGLAIVAASAVLQSFSTAETAKIARPFP
jgi:hypothetical protein